MVTPREKKRGPLSACLSFCASTLAMFCFHRLDDALHACLKHSLHLHLRTFCFVSLLLASVSRGLSFDKMSFVLSSSRSKATLLSVGQLEHFGQRDTARPRSQAWAWLFKKKVERKMSGFSCMFF